MGRRETESDDGDLSKGQLWVRWLDRYETSPLADTEGARSPVLSADGLAVAFWAKNAIRQVPLGGGPVTILVPDVRVPPARMVWTRSGRIIFDNMWTVNVLLQSSHGGVPTPVTALQGAEIVHSLPELVDDDRAVLFTARTSKYIWGMESIIAQDLTTGERTVVMGRPPMGGICPPGTCCSCGTASSGQPGSTPGTGE